MSMSWQRPSVINNHNHGGEGDSNYILFQFWEEESKASVKGQAQGISRAVLTQDALDIALSCPLTLWLLPFSYCGPIIPFFMQHLFMSLLGNSTHKLSWFLCVIHPCRAFRNTTQLYIGATEVSQSAPCILSSLMGSQLAHKQSHSKSQGLYSTVSAGGLPFSCLL